MEVSRSAPDINKSSPNEVESERAHSPDADGLRRRAESEPNLATTDDDDKS